MIPCLYDSMVLPLIGSLFTEVKTSLASALNASLELRTEKLKQRYVLDTHHFDLSRHQFPKCL